MTPRGLFVTVEVVNRHAELLAADGGTDALRLAESKTVVGKVVLTP
ncbi:hypothetical protein ACN27G_34035 [Plantactinospora sp. WMMB334]